MFGFQLFCTTLHRTGALVTPRTQALLHQDVPVGTRPALPPGRVLFVVAPYAAHAMPLARLAQELAGRGHAVTFSSTSDFTSLDYGKLVGAPRACSHRGRLHAPSGPPCRQAEEGADGEES